MRVAFIALLGLSACATAGAQVPPADDMAPSAYLEKDLADIVGLIQGRWDNDRHGFFAEASGMDDEAIADRQHLVIRPAGEDDPNTVIASRQMEDGEPIVIRHAFQIGSDGLEQVSSLVTDDGGSAPAPCTIDWARSGGGFAGVARTDGCIWMFRPAGEAGASPASLRLSEDDFWVATHSAEARFRRARPFECWVAVARGVEHGEGGEDADWFFQRGVRLHDQYGEAIVETDEDPARAVHLRLRNVEWPYGANRPSLTLYVHDRGADRATSYAWTEYDADRLGINLRWLQASCTHEPDLVFEDF